MNELKLSVDNCYHNDWVIYEGEKHQIHSTCTEFPFLKDARFGLGVVTWDNIKPIVLTPEILVKYGFANKPESKLSFNIYLVISEPDLYLVYQNGTIWIGEYNTMIAHLHTLQQLIRLFTQKEIEVKWEK